MSDNGNERSEAYGSRLGIRIFYRLLRSVGVYPAYVLLAVVILYYTCLPGVARSTRQYLERRFPSDGRFRRFLRRYRYVFEFGLTLIDQAAMGIVGPEAFTVEFPGDQEFYALSRRQEGTVLLTSHIGAWQIAMAHLRQVDKRVALLMRLDQGRKDMHFFDLAGERSKFSFIDPAGFMGGLVEATRALRSHECVAVMGDRAHEWRVGRAMFLGSEAPFPLVAEHLAAVTDSRLIMLLTRRLGPMKFSIRYVDLTAKARDLLGHRPGGDADSGDPEEDRLSLQERSGEHDLAGDTLAAGKIGGRELAKVFLRLYVDELEAYVSENPYGWFNFFDFWQSGTGGEVAAGSIGKRKEQNFSLPVSAAAGDDLSDTQ